MRENGKFPLPVVSKGVTIFIVQRGLRGGMITRGKTLFALFAILALTSVTAQSVESKDLAPPVEPGPYPVGIRTFENVPMTGGRLTRVHPPRDSRSAWGEEVEAIDLGICF